RQSVSTEDEMDSRTIWKLPKADSDFLNERLNIQRMIVKLANRFLRRPAFWLAVNWLPFFQAAQRGGVRKMRINRQQNNSIELPGGAQRLDCVVSQRLPVPHRRDRDYIQLRRQCRNQCASLTFCENSNRRTAANHRVASAHRNGTLLCNVICQRLPE